MMHQYRGVAYIFLTAFLWSLGGLLYRMVDWNATLIAGECDRASVYISRFLFAVCMLISSPKTDC